MFLEKKTENSFISNPNKSFKFQAATKKVTNLLAIRKASRNKNSLLEDVQNYGLNYDAKILSEPPFPVKNVYFILISL